MSTITKLSIFLLLILAISCNLEPKKSVTIEENRLSEKEMLDDYQLFKNIFEQANAGLYKYHTKQAIDSVFEANERLINDKLSYREYYTVLWNVIDYTGSCHNELYFPDSLKQQLNKEPIYFPLPLKHLDDKIYTKHKFETIPKGSEIIAVNNIPSKKLASLLANYTSTDGHNKTGKYAFIETGRLARYMYLIFGKQQHFEIVYKGENSSSIKEQITAVDYTTFLNNFKKKQTKIEEEKEYSFKYIDTIKSGYLKVKTFGMGGPDSEGHKQYAKFLDSVFIQLKTNKTANLIVDVRNNGGGNDPNDILLYSYLTKRKFKENTSAYTIFQDIPFKEHYIDDDINELPQSLKEEHSIFKDGKYYQNNSFNKVWNPNKNAFNGTIYLLVDPFVASAGSLFASLVKSDEQTIVIGEETAGGYYGHTGHIPVHYQLPNSKLILQFSIVDLEQDVKELPDENYGDGIKPDFNVIQSHSDFINKKDTQLNFTINLIKK